MALWRVTVEIPTGRVVWRHRYAVVAADEASAKARAVEQLTVEPGAELTVTAEPIPDAVFCVSLWVGKPGDTEVTP